MALYTENLCQHTQNIHEINTAEMKNNLLEINVEAELVQYPSMPNNRPDICITEIYLRNFKLEVSENSSTVSTSRNGIKIFLVGHNHENRIRRNNSSNTF